MKEEKKKIITKEFIIKHSKNCSICNEQMKMEEKEWDLINRILTVEYKCFKCHKIIIKSIRNIEINNYA